MGREESVPSRRLPRLEVRRREGLGAAGNQGRLPGLQPLESGGGAQGRGDRREAAPPGSVLLHQRSSRRLQGGGEADRGGDVGAPLAPRPRYGALPGGVRGTGGRSDQRRSEVGGFREWNGMLSGGSGVADVNRVTSVLMRLPNFDVLVLALNLFYYYVTAQKPLKYQLCCHPPKKPSSPRNHLLPRGSRACPRTDHPSSCHVSNAPCTYERGT